MEVLTRIPVEYESASLLPRLRVAENSGDAAALRELVDRVRAVVNPKGLYEACYVEHSSDDTVRIGDIVFSSRVLRVNLEDAHRVFPFVVTCGRELDEIEDVRGDPLRAYWLEELKVMALRAASARVREEIETRYHPGELSSMSPGSLKDWPITQQKQLFALLGNVEEMIGVGLTDSFLMLPMKSVSGIYFPTERSFESCQLCPREGCPGRAAPYDPMLWEERYEKSGCTSSQ
ncbi:MAG: vitamin B12 dependent methionine synthase [Armatimonadetes bacterium]|nr:vitamin B12 dependent methionine synthase [Armatimonadota bacterium]